MRTLILGLGLIFAALPAHAETIGPAEVNAHVGQTVTVEGAVSDVRTGRSGARHSSTSAAAIRTTISPR